MHSAKTPVFDTTIDQRQSRHSPRIKSRRNVADLMNPERLRFNRFSNPLLHSEALTQIHDMPGSTIVTSFGRVISVRGSIARLRIAEELQSFFSQGQFGRDMVAELNKIIHEQRAREGSRS